MKSGVPKDVALDRLNAKNADYLDKFREEYKSAKKSITNEFKGTKDVAKRAFVHAGNGLTLLDMILAVRSDDANLVLKSAVVAATGLIAGTIAAAATTTTAGAIIGAVAVGLVTITVATVWDYLGLGELTGLSGQSFQDKVFETMDIVSEHWNEWKKGDFSYFDQFDDFLVDSIKDGWNWFTGNIRDWLGLPRVDGVVIYDPLTLDLDGDGIETIASNGHDGALFDHDKNGIRTATGWVGKDDGFLVYDRNGDGVVNDGGELFGDNTLLKNGERAANGYQALADLDDNGDGKVDTADSAFAKLRVWRDLNQDGISQEGELLTLNEAKVKALNLANKNADRDLGNGNSLAEEGTYTDSDGNEKQMGDLNLAADHFHSRFSDSVPLTDEQQQAPNLRGSGRVRDLREAAARSPELAEALQQYKNAATKEEQLTLRHENTAMTPGKPCHEYAEKDRLKALQGCNKSVQFPQNTTQTPHNNTWICRNNQHSRTSHDKPTDQYRPQAAASCSVSCLWYCPTLGLQ